MFMFVFEGMLENHIRDNDARKKITDEGKVNNPYKNVFENLLIGVNIIHTDVIDDIAVYLSNLSEEEIEKITLEDVIKNVGNYIDTSGYLA